MTSTQIELLAPGGDIDAIKAAILAGAHAIYCGLDKFNARNRAANISLEDLNGILHLAHQNNCKIFLTLNIIILEKEINALVSLLNKLANTSIDGLIIQDIGLLYILRNHFPDFEVHASTQMTTHNKGQIRFLEKLCVKRVNLSRELNMEEIKSLTAFGLENDVDTEVFVHGSNCISFSGICYMSSVQNGNSGNRGRCSQPCRDAYLNNPTEIDYPLNMKDNSAYFDIKELIEAGVSSLKIEGRIKKYDYVFSVVNAWRKQIDYFIQNKTILKDNSILYKVFNRDFSNSYLKGQMGSEMFIDSPRDYSIQHLSNTQSFSSKEELEKASLKLYEEKDQIRLNVEEKINQLEIALPKLSIHVSGDIGQLLKVELRFEDQSLWFQSEQKMVSAEEEALDREVVWKRFKAFEETPFQVTELDMTGLAKGVSIPYQELTKLKNRILFKLNNDRLWKNPILLPKLKQAKHSSQTPLLSILISSKKEASLAQNKELAVYFELPNCFDEDLTTWIGFFQENEKLIPYFPSVIIGENYEKAVKLLLGIKPTIIVTNNTGIAYEAYKNKIDWIAGPSLNLVNSYSLLALKETYNAKGAFISNELSRIQIQQLKKPSDFKLFYSIFHPSILMTTRQCLFHQTTGCEKENVDNDCLLYCEKSTSITNAKLNQYFIEKSEGNYHRIFDENHFLNLEIIKDLPHLFDGFAIDMRNIKTKTNIEESRECMIELFRQSINGEQEPTILKSLLSPSSNASYDKGI